MKRLLSLVLILLLVTSVLSSSLLAFKAEGLQNFQNKLTYTQGQYTDVPSWEWYAGSVKEAFELGLMNGTSLTTFRPKGNITQAQALTIAARLNKIYATGNDNFSEISVEMQQQESKVLAWANASKANPAYAEFYTAWYSPYVYYLSAYTDGNHYPTYPAYGLNPNGAPFINASNPITRAEFAY